MTQKEIQDMLDNMTSLLGSHLSDEGLEQRYFARQSRDKEKTRKHYKELGNECVRSGRHKEVSSKGGRTVTDYKREVILNNNKKKRALTDEDVINMKELYRTDITIGFAELADMYGVNKVVIHNIMNGLTYVGIGGEVTIRQPKKTCEHCPAPPMSPANYKRHHGDNCKHKK